MGIDGRVVFGCATKPKDGMVVYYDREDLNKERLQRLKAYANCSNGSCCGC